MSYQVLARKWRPQTFADVIGQEHVLIALANSLSLDKVHHAYLLSGTRGVGKTTIARLLAKGLNCETGVTATPCGRCDNCHEIKQGCFVDLVEIDAASRTKVEDIRELIDNIQYVPTRGRFKVYIIDEVHMLSRHSFNALLKTLEEPPAHIKFLLATTDPQKLPVTVLSRCLHFHLKTLTLEKIRDQLVSILQQEHIKTEPRVLQLLARAAEGSMRDALSLTDQAIAMGQRVITEETVSQMLGTINIKQPLAIIEALVDANGGAIMAQLAQCATRGMDWENLLVEMLSLLHRIAMGQMLPDQLNDEEEQSVLPRLRELARRVSPSDLQLYYQTLLVGRKELPFAPDHRMGVEMTLLRALAFHPAATVMEVEVPANIGRKTVESSAGTRTDLKTDTTRLSQQASDTTGARNRADKSLMQASSSFNDDCSDGAINNWHDMLPTPPKVTGPSSAILPDATAQLLQARTTLLHHQENQKIKKDKSAPGLHKSAISALESLTAVSKRSQHRPSVSNQEDHSMKQAAQFKDKEYHWRVGQHLETTKLSPAAPKMLCTALEEKTPELVSCLIQETLQRDSWSAQVHRLTVPKLAKQLALNSWKEDLAPGKVCLHLRSAQRNLNSETAQSALSKALSVDLGTQIELTVKENDNPAVKTPLEWCQAIYEEKLIQARKAIMTDTHIQMLQCFFDAELDEGSIRPV
ncbi:MAG: Holliday junction ATP-dependent DNA helicase RuvB [Sodalis sp. Psp]|nr:Holliday junction ATP-dependent DNA helicase RuvB [Sodalis sp. Psp]MCR3757216.1 Holliday junction ATP-dependent DNA helicase RuvB [Sodalis sp. Ppy]